MLRCVYINLDRAVERREALEASFAKHATPGFELVRFPAIDTKHPQLIPGKVRAADRACFMSHRQVVLDHPDDGPPLMVMEDDVQFGPTFFRTIGDILASPKLNWDIIFTDVCVPNTAMMAELARARPKLVQGGTMRVTMVDLVKAPYAALAGYGVNPKSLRKMKAMLRSIRQMDCAYDMFVRALVHQKHLKAAVTFPFLTTLSEHSEVSAIQADDTSATDLIWNTFRKAMWADRDLAACEPLLRTIREQYCDEEAMRLAPIFCAQASARYRSK
jgi:GR25 family glycosyltransferase involved in LPS biosynthesis